MDSKPPVTKTMAKRKLSFTLSSDIVVGESPKNSDRDTNKDTNGGTLRNQKKSEPRRGTQKRTKLKFDPQPKQGSQPLPISYIYPTKTDANLTCWVDTVVKTIPVQPRQTQYDGWILLSKQTFVNTIVNTADS